jgi:hypothetical protein
VRGESCGVEMVGTVGERIRDGQSAQACSFGGRVRSRRLLSIILGSGLVERVPFCRG